MPMRSKWAYSCMWNHNTLNVKTVWLEELENHSVALMLKKNLLMRLLISQPENMFFLGPSMTKLVFRFCEMPIFTFESCACHRKMNMNFALHFTKSHEYHVFAFSRKNNENETDNPSQGAESTVYLVFGFSVARSRIFVPKSSSRFNM